MKTNNIFVKPAEALYVNDYKGGMTDSANVTIDKDNIIYVDVDVEYAQKQSYLEDNIFYCQEGTFKIDE